MCHYIEPIETKTRFILLMHPKEFKRTKNGTGHFTNLSLKKCEIFIGIDFTNHTRINKIIQNPNNISFVLYPSERSINLNDTPLETNGKTPIIFLIDATWPCSRAMLKASSNLNALPKISFSHTKRSAFQFKEQPQTYCLSTMESTHILLERLEEQKIEAFKKGELETFLRPFHKMVSYQVTYTED